MISGIIEKNKPRSAILCTVVGQQEELMLALRSGVRFVYKLDMNIGLPIMNAYRSPETLGADRLALAVGAFVTSPIRMYWWWSWYLYHL